MSQHVYLQPSGNTVSFGMTLKAKLFSLSVLFYVLISAGLITELCVKVDFLLHQPELQLLSVLEKS